MSCSFDPGYFTATVVLRGSLRHVQHPYNCSYRVSDHLQPRSLPAHYTCSHVRWQLGRAGSCAIATFLQNGWVGEISILPRRHSQLLQVNRTRKAVVEPVTEQKLGQQVKPANLLLPTGWVGIPNFLSDAESSGAT